MLFGVMGLKSNASHIPGGWIEYECVGTDSFLVHLHLYRHCAGIPIMPSTNSTATSTCGGSVTAAITVTPDPVTGLSPVDISQVCSTDSPNNDCFSGSFPGLQLQHLSGIVVLSPACDTWTISWSKCC
jgi:hypothetical protein